MPNFGQFADPAELVAIAVDAEEAGWDGVFLWDHVRGMAAPVPVLDPWVGLAAIAQATTRIRLGPMVTPVSRRRPTKLARETVTLDHLSGGRLVLGVGLGAPPDVDFADVGEVADDRLRAEMLDEGLDLIAALWSGEAVVHHGRHYRVDGASFLPKPVQTPRIPVWVAGYWPNRPPFRRAARWDGVFPITIGDGPEDFRPTTPEGLRTILTYVRRHRRREEPLDVVLSGHTPADPALAMERIGPLADAGITWWHELPPWRVPVAEWRERVRAGPPRP